MSQTIGFVYLLTNPYMQSDVYKIGCTERSPHARAEELSKHTGVPAPFVVRCYIEVENFQQVERDLHAWLKAYRISPNREFFDGGLKHAVAYLWWHRKRLAFCEPLRPDEVSMLWTEEDLFGLERFDALPDPWAPKQLPEPSAATEPVDVPDPAVSKSFAAFIEKTTEPVVGGSLGDLDGADVPF